jgi:hypothetical protein
MTRTKANLSPFERELLEVLKRISTSLTQIAELIEEAVNDADEDEDEDDDDSTDYEDEDDE